MRYFARLLKFVVRVQLVLVLSLPLHALAQRADPDGELMTQGPRRHISTIVFAGLAGAILGLSTLSFYGRPQDRLNNIAMGFGIGVIGGAMFTTYKAAAEPKDFYGESLQWRRIEPTAWQEHEDRATHALNQRSLSFSFTF